MDYLEYRNLISFVPEKTEHVHQKGCIKKDELGSEAKLTGDEAKSFYENIIADEGDSVSVAVERHTCCNKKERLRKYGRKGNKGNGCQVQHGKEGDNIKFDTNTNSCSRLTDTVPESESKMSERAGYNLLKCSEQGELREVKMCIRRGISVDFQDSYGWTALMCSSVVGQIDVVKHLIDAGASLSQQNKQGKNALQLAKEAGMKHVVAVLQNSSIDNCEPRYTKRHKLKSEKFYCTVCDHEFRDCTEAAHQSSTVHLFNMKLEPKPDPFFIPPSNIGFKLMRKSGWDGAQGLGPEGTGLKFPVKTVLKRDRACLGSNKDDKRQTKAKITHFGPNDRRSVQSLPKCTKRVESARVLSKRARKRKEMKDKEWERNLRQYMNTD